MRRLASLLAPIGLGFSLGLSLLLAAPVAAQDRSGTVEISPFGGAAFGGSIYTNAVLGTYDRKLDVGNTGTFGLRVGYVFNRYAGIELGWSHTQSGLYLGSSGAFSPQTRVGDFNTDTIEVNGIFAFGRGKFIPYFTVGGGANMMQMKANGYTSSTETRFVGNLGLGAKVWLTPKLGLRFEGRVRSTYMGDGGNNNCRDYYCNYYSDGNWYTSGEVTGGLSFAF